MTRHPDVAAVVIGRNEGQRLLACLASLSGQVARIIYVDSGSTDGSIEAARGAGAEVVELDRATPFTAARARNAGFDVVMSEGATPTFVQFVDGDCEVRPGWIESAHAFLADHDDVVAVCGRRRERFPEASIYNRLADDEWNTPVGDAEAFGGDVLIRAAPLRDVGGYNPDLIAGEEPELAIRLRRAGWRIWRLDAEMTLHDAALTRFGQWWQRARRAGFACAQGVRMYGFGPERHGVRVLRSIVFWGGALPVFLLVAAVVAPAAMLLALAYPLKILRRIMVGDSLRYAAFMTLAKIPEMQGALTYLWRRTIRTGPRIIEYK